MSDTGGNLTDEVDAFGAGSETAIRWVPLHQPIPAIAPAAPWTLPPVGRSAYPREHHKR